MSVIGTDDRQMTNCNHVLQIYIFGLKNKNKSRLRGVSRGRLPP